MGCCFDKVWQVFVRGSFPMIVALICICVNQALSVSETESSTSGGDDTVISANNSTGNAGGNSTAAGDVDKNNKEDDDDGGSNAGLIAGLILPIVLVIVVAIVLYIVHKRRSRMMDNEKKMKIQMTSARNAGVYQDLTVTSVPGDVEKPPASPEHEHLKATEEI